MNSGGFKDYTYLYTVASISSTWELKPIRTGNVSACISMHNLTEREGDREQHVHTKRTPQNPARLSYASAHHNLQAYYDIQYACPTQGAHSDGRTPSQAKTAASFQDKHTALDLFLISLVPNDD